jgi:hypothetical protein
MRQRLLISNKKIYQERESKGYGKKWTERLTTKCEETFTEVKS